MLIYIKLKLILIIDAVVFVNTMSDPVVNYSMNSGEALLIFSLKPCEIHFKKREEGGFRFRSLSRQGRLEIS